MIALCSFETWITVCQSVQCNIPEELNLHQHHCENFKSLIIIFVWEAKYVLYVGKRLIRIFKFSITVQSRRVALYPSSSEGPAAGSNKFSGFIKGWIGWVTVSFTRTLLDGMSDILQLIINELNPKLLWCRFLLFLLKYISRAINNGFWRPNFSDTFFCDISLLQLGCWALSLASQNYYLLWSTFYDTKNIIYNIFLFNIVITQNFTCCDTE